MRRSRVIIRFVGADHPFYTQKSKKGVKNAEKRVKNKVIFIFLLQIYVIILSVLSADAPKECASQMRKRPTARRAVRMKGLIMIRVEHLSKRYGTRYALDDVSFTIEKGEIVGLLGANGAGKSTTMNILTGYLSATEGEVYVDGVSVLDDPTAAKRKIGYLPEQPPLYFDMTVKEYLGFVYELRGCKLPREAHLATVMEEVKITDVKDRLIGQLSKGYRQRVGIASALVNDPPLLIFDEPTVGLDPKQIIEVRNLLRTLGKKHTVVLSTHILSEVQAVCERIVVIKEGHIVANERTEDITRRMEEDGRFRFKIAGAPSGEILGTLKGIRDVARAEQVGGRDGESYTFNVETRGGADVRRAVFNLCVERKWTLYGMEKRGMELEDVFIRLMDDRADEPQETGKRRR